MKIEKKIRKGDLVRVNEARCFTQQNGGTRPYPLTNHRNDDNRIIYGHYIRTAEDDRKWREEKRKATEEARARGEDTFSINFNDAGESRLPGVSVLVDIPAGRVYEVLRSRCRARLSYGNPTPGLMKLLDTHSGREVYVKRDYMELV
tara:strand:+ start:111 stop:551 length:441 start_codon:yes stop_codon:yes gene_type:complete